MKHSFVKKTALSCLSALILFSHSASAEEETIPIPPRRPDVLNVSPAYIKQLIEQNEPAASQAFFDDVQEDVFLSSDESSDEFIIDEELPVDDVIAEEETEEPSEYILADDQEENELESIDQHMVLAALEGDTITEADEAIIPPIPSRKPNIVSEKSDAGQKSKRDDRALISFALNPDQIDLDPMLEEFLSEYAVDMFRNDPKLKMEIFAYATPEDDKDFSDVRRALARALEVRSYLLSQNIQASRLKLNAVGQDESNKSDNRIDLVFTAVE